MSERHEAAGGGGPAPEPDDAEAAEGLSPAAAFALLGDETRIDILGALMEAEVHDIHEPPLSFSELYERVDVEDTARFNYHLGRLVGHFIEKTDEGYRFRYAGRKVVRAVIAGSFNERGRLGPLSVEGTCAECGAEALRAEYAEEYLLVTCADCGEALTGNHFPPGALDHHDPDSAMRAFDRVVRERVRLAADGVCSECMGPMTGEVTEEIPAEWGFDVLPFYECDACCNWVAPSFGMLVLDHPAVVSFLHEQGERVDDRPYWDVPVCVSDRYWDVESEDPWRVRVTVPGDDEQLAVVVDGDLAVVSVDREPVASDLRAGELEAGAAEDD